MGRRLISIFILFLFFMVIITGCSRKPADSAEEKEPIPVRVERVATQDLVEYRFFSGTVEAAGQVQITAKMAGRVKEVLVKAGDRVKAGQVLVKLEGQEVESQVKQARAGYQAALANYNKISTQLEQEVQRLESAVRQAEENYNNAKQNYERMSKLYQDGAISQKDFEGIELQYKIAKEQYESSREQLDIMKNKSVPETMTAAKAQVEQAEAALSAAESALENTMITAPIDGVVGNVDVKVGQLISPGVPVAVVGNTGSMSVKINVTEDVINSVKIGQEVEVSVEAVGVNLKGTVTSVSPYKNLQTGTYPVEVRITEVPEGVKPGMFARVKLAVSSYPKVLAVPEECVIKKDEKNVVFKVEDGKAKAVEVVPGPTVGGFTVIEKGLEEGMEIVVEGQEYLEDGAPVEVVGKEEGK
ncbi:MAG: efflux RND transporter periplasmic adaptor subunit [Thermosediminibacteraceae bacterium]|nr:efflux RND transporter periplasmic adaptor subunit [Thermosediminibacteraceae bacterium]